MWTSQSANREALSVYETKWHLQIQVYIIIVLYLFIFVKKRKRHLRSINPDPWDRRSRVSQQWTGLSVDESQFDKATHCRGEALKTHTVHDDTQALEQHWVYTHLYISLAWIPWSAEFLWWACAQTQSRTAVRIWCCPGWGSLPGWNPAWSPWALWHPGEPRREEHWLPEQTNHIVCKCFFIILL